MTPSAPSTTAARPLAIPAGTVPGAVRGRGGDDRGEGLRVELAGGVLGHVVEVRRDHTVVVEVEILPVDLVTAGDARGIRGQRLRVDRVRRDLRRVAGVVAYLGLDIPLPAQHLVAGEGAGGEERDEPLRVLPALPQFTDVGGDLSVGSDGLRRRAGVLDRRDREQGVSAGVRLHSVGVAGLHSGDRGEQSVGGRGVLLDRRGHETRRDRGCLSSHVFLLLGLVALGVIRRGGRLVGGISDHVGHSFDEVVDGLFDRVESGEQCSGLERALRDYSSASQSG